jgi:drug/metabolite transporter (DMT)-like permease
LQPVFVALLARVFLREVTSNQVWFGIVVALGGAIAIASDATGGANASSLHGDLLALGGALAIAVYVLVGRAVHDVDVLAYSATVSLVAALVLLPLCLVEQAPLLTLSSSSWFWIATVALVPQLVGHTALNHALRLLPASIVSGSILGEPVIATVLAWLVLEQTPGPRTLVGAGVVLAGLALLLRAPRLAQR